MFFIVPVPFFLVVFFSFVLLRSGTLRIAPFDKTLGAGISFAALKASLRCTAS